MFESGVPRGFRFFYVLFPPPPSRYLCGNQQDHTIMSLLIESSEQLRALTGSYYANNDFAKVQGDIDQATDELEKILEGISFKLEDFG